jgi:hypothetical protein
MQALATPAAVSTLRPARGHAASCHHDTVKARTMDGDGMTRELLKALSSSADTKGSTGFFGISWETAQGPPLRGGSSTSLRARAGACCGLLWSKWKETQEKQDPRRYHPAGGGGDGWSVDVSLQKAIYAV